MLKPPTPSADMPSGPSTFRRIHIVVNPAAGMDEPILGTFNRVFGGAGIAWDVSITHKAGDGRRLAQAAVASGAELVAAYGGDGTVMETASGLIGGSVPLAILPGGTLNVLALQFGIPRNLEQACTLICTGNTLQAIDVGQAGEQYFLARLSCGLEAATIEGANREAKDRLGWLAYVFSALQALSESNDAHYALTLDGKAHEYDGVACIVANSGQIGLMGTGTSMAPGISMTDGVFDVLLVRQADLATLVALTTNMLSGSGDAPALLRWKAREISIDSDPPQALHCDGEIIGTTPIDVKLLPGAVRVLVPTLAPAAPPAGSP